MKKNKFVKIACAMLTMCLITTCAISTTLAKYTTGTEAADTARVAKWGVEVSASGTMFGKNYGANGASQYENTIAANVTGSVDTSDGSKIVAPGTKNETGIQIKLKGQPEVAFDVNASGTLESEIYLNEGEYGVMVEAYGINPATDFNAEELYTLAGTTYTKATTFTAGTTYYRLTNYVNVAAAYYPIVWSGYITATNTEGVGSGSATFATLADALDALVGGINALPNFEANDNIDLVYKLTWAWAFENGENDAEKLYYSKCDTILGDLQAGRSVVIKTGTNTYGAPTAFDGTNPNNYCLTIKCNIGATATQID